MSHRSPCIVPAVAEKGKGKLEMISALQLKKGVKEGQPTYLAAIRVEQDKLPEEPLPREIVELLGKGMLCPQSCPRNFRHAGQ